MKRIIIISLIGGLALAGCGGSTKTNTTVTARSQTASVTTTTSATTTTTTPSVPIAQDKNPSQPYYWAPQYENGLVSACVHNKIAMSEGICTCIVARLQSHHPALAESPADRNVVRRWMITASGNPYGLRESALSCSSR